MNLNLYSRYLLLKPVLRNLIKEIDREEEHLLSMIALKGMGFCLFVIFLLKEVRL